MRVLAVDDDELVRDLVRLKLGQAGFEVTTAADGPEGLELARDGGFDLILLDVMMPRMSGVEVCRRLRDHGPTRSTPVALLTLRSREADVEQGFAAGADDYIVKPFSPRELLSRVVALTRPGAPRPRAAGPGQPPAEPVPVAGGATTTTVLSRRPVDAGEPAGGSGRDAELARAIATLAATVDANHREAIQAVATLQRSLDELTAALRGGGSGDEAASATGSRLRTRRRSADGRR